MFHSRKANLSPDNLTAICDTLSRKCGFLGLASLRGLDDLLQGQLHFIYMIKKAKLIDKFYLKYFFTIINVVTYLS
jgi:hypothetical protein